MLVSVVGFYTEHVNSICTGICLIIFLPLRYIYIFYVKHSAGERPDRDERARQVSLSILHHSAWFVQICTEITPFDNHAVHVPVSVLPLPLKTKLQFVIFKLNKMTSR